MDEADTIHKHVSAEKLAKIRAFSKDKETPFLLIDLAHVRSQYAELTASMPTARVFLR